MKYILTTQINGVSREAAVSAKTTLAEFLRYEMGLTGLKQGCGEGECGACTVLLDGVPVSSCLVLALEAEGREITTIEGLGTPAKLHPLQESFVEHGAIQCGFCTPGMILTAKSLLEKTPAPKESDIRSALSGNLCRCTGYQKIVEAVSRVARETREKGGAGR